MGHSLPHRFRRCVLMGVSVTLHVEPTISLVCMYVCSHSMSLLLLLGTVGE